MKCSVCQNENQAEASFCSECGSELTAETTVRGQATAPSAPLPAMAEECPSCGATRWDDAPFCRTCGQKFAAGAPPQPDVTPTATAIPTIAPATAVGVGTHDPTIVNTQLPPMGTPEPTAVQPIQPAPVPQPAASQRPTSSNGALIGVLAFAGVLVVAGIVLLLWDGGGTKPPVTTHGGSVPASITRPGNATSPTVATTTTAAAGDLGLPTAMQQPPCDDAHITIVASAIDPASYAATVSAALASFPGSNYLISTNCPSLRQDLDGNEIYVIYFGPFPQVQDACDARASGGPDSYVRTLSQTLPATHTVSC